MNKLFACVLWLSLVSCEYKNVIGTTGLTFDNLKTNHGLITAEFKITQLRNETYFYPLLIYRSDSGVMGPLTPPSHESVGNGPSRANYIIFENEVAATPKKGEVILINRKTKTYKLLSGVHWSLEDWSNISSNIKTKEEKRSHAIMFIDKILAQNATEVTNFLEASSTEVN